MTALLAGTSLLAGNNLTSTTNNKPYWKEAGFFELRKEYQAMRQGHTEPRQHGLKSASGIAAARGRLQAGYYPKEDFAMLDTRLDPCKTRRPYRGEKRFLKNYKFVLFWNLSIRFDEKNRIYRQIHYKTFGILKKPFYFCSTQSGNLRISLT